MRARYERINRLYESSEPNPGALLSHAISSGNPLAAAGLFAIATPLLGNVFEPGGVTVGRMIRVMGRFRSMSIEYNGDFLFDYVYTHLARIADFVAREESGEKRERS